MTLDAEAQVYSPLDALDRANTIRCIALASPLDWFAAYRFLLTLLYWKADTTGGVTQLRELLLKGEMPRVVLNAIKAEAHCFHMFDDKSPFLQDPSARDDKQKSVGSLFSEFASGTNIAHFHHGDDKKMRLCVRCATIGMLRMVPWSQSGGQGLTPSVHNAPPIMAIASGSSLATTLGLNLVPIPVDAGVAKWTGHFVPTAKGARIPYLEALTWNPRRVHLLSLQRGDDCWRCGQVGVATVGPIVYLKNQETSKQSDGTPFKWEDPAAFYAVDTPYTTMKSGLDRKKKGPMAASGRDMDWLLRKESPPMSLVASQNPNHQGWRIIIPGTNPANNKTFDHRQLELPSLSPDAVRATLPADEPFSRPPGLDGWVEPERRACAGGATRFVEAAARFLTYADWAELSNAAYKDMHDSPAAFDLFSGLFWGLRKAVDGLPSKNVAWLVLKLMATVPARARVPHANAAFCPLRSLPKRQLDECRKDRSPASPYPVSLPSGRRLEADLRVALNRNMRQRKPDHVDWAGLCHDLDQLLDNNLRKE
jgi:hypothetical protein